MPTYSYRCKKCQHEYERFQKISDESRPPCPECGGKAERVISGGAGIHFKGSGFYITDYGKSGARKPDEKSKPDGEKKESKTPPKKKEADS